LEISLIKKKLRIKNTLSSFFPNPEVKLQMVHV